MKRYSTLLLSLLITLPLLAQVSYSNALRKLQIAEYAISQLYVDKVDEDKLVEKAIIEMLAQLDPHSTYISAEEIKEMEEPLKGNFSGIGIQFQMREDTLLVMQPTIDGPSEKVGIIAGDRIIAVNDTVIAGVKMSTNNIMSRLRGRKGTTVNLTIKRNTINKLLNFKVTRDKIPIHSITAYYMIDNQTGYIKIDRFSATTNEEFLATIKKLKTQGMRNMILDLEGNGGGYLQAAISIANQFLEKDNLIVYTLGKNEDRSEFYAKEEGVFTKGKVVVLIDEFSASASEIVAGAIQDWDRGVIVGRRSFGKGLVQRPIPLPDNSVIRLTVAKYYTPSGRCIQKPYMSSVDLDLNKGKGKGNDAKKNIRDYNLDIINRYENGELMSADSIHFIDSLKVSTINLHRPVYGGGGIMPDVFVPLDTLNVTELFRNLNGQGTIINYSIKYTDLHRLQLQKEYPTFEKFDTYFKVTDKVLEGLKKEAKKEGIKWNDEEYQRSKKFINAQFKALIARHLFGTTAFIKIINKTDDTTQKALNIINSERYNTILSNHETPIYLQKPKD